MFFALSFLPVFKTLIFSFYTSIIQFELLEDHFDYASLGV